MQIAREYSSYSKFLEFVRGFGEETRRQFDQLNHVRTRTDVSYILADRDRENFFGLTDDEHLAAYGFLQKVARKNKTLTLGIVVTDEYQGRGYGGLVCEEMLRWAWRHKYQKVWLGTYEDNTAALKLYKRLGFELEGVFVGDLDDGRSIYSLAKFRDYVGQVRRMELTTRWLQL